MINLNRRRILSSVSAFLGSSLLAQFFTSKTAEAATWKKLQVGPPVRGIYGWGGNTAGGLGNNSTTQVNLPIRICGNIDALTVSVGNLHSMALTTSGCIMAWGCNSDGQLGDGTTTDRLTPITVCGISTAIAIAAGAGHSLAVLADGTVKSWGFGGFDGAGSGQLGDNTEISKCLPVSVCGISTAVAVVASQNFSQALLSDGTVRTWGRGDSGRLGNGASSSASTPVTVTGISTAVAISRSAALLANGTIANWGDATNGMLGNATTSGNKCTPVIVCCITNAIAVNKDASNGYALLSSGAVMAWGDSGASNSSIGDGGSGHRSTPVAVCGISNAVAIDFQMALLSTGTIKVWGNNQYGQSGSCTWDAFLSTPVSVCNISNAFATVARAKMSRRYPVFTRSESGNILFLHLG